MYFWIIRGFFFIILFVIPQSHTFLVLYVLGADKHLFFQAFFLNRINKAALEII